MNIIDKQQGSQTERLQDFLRFGFKRITKQQSSQTTFSVIPRSFGLRELQNNKALKPSRRKKQIIGEFKRITKQQGSQTSAPAIIGSIWFKRITKQQGSQTVDVDDVEEGGFKRITKQQGSQTCSSFSLIVFTFKRITKQQGSQTVIVR